MRIMASPNEMPINPNIDAINMSGKRSILMVDVISNDGSTNEATAVTATTITWTF